MIQEPLKLKTIGFCNTKDREQKLYKNNQMILQWKRFKSFRSLKNNCGYYTKMGAKTIPEKPNGFAMKVAQEPSKLKNHCFCYTEDREQK